MDATLLKRSRILKQVEIKNGPVVYWMSRDQRVDQNWALIFASEQAKDRNLPLYVVFSLSPDFLGATFRQYGFMLKGLKQVQTRLKELNIPFYLLMGQPSVEVANFCKQLGVSTLVTDFDPLKVKRQWKKEITSSVDCTIYTVDAHNVVPAFVVSDKAEFGAYTIRPKIKRLLPEFLTDFPQMPWQKNNSGAYFPEIVWEQVISAMNADALVQEVDWCKPGADEANKVLDEFIQHKLINYDTLRNDPIVDGTSNLSPYLHFGQISSQFVAQQVVKTNINTASVEAFLEELIVRKELSDNFCLYNPHYDSFSGFPSWARKTLDEHRSDPREFNYSTQEFEDAQTHDDLWNAAQFEMVNKGKMHGYMRMYWAKKILEWSASPERALETAIYLNDKYELDGRDPNGYTGCAWAIGGVHDRAWSQRPVYGMIRYMNYKGSQRKFNVKAYVASNLVRSPEDQ